MVMVDIVYEGELHCRATHGPSGDVMNTDAPVDNKGKGEAFSPTDLVGTALGTCILTIMGIAAERHGLDMRGARASVEKTMVAHPVRRIGELRVAIHVPGKLDEASRKLLERAGLGCPVRASLASSVEVSVEFRWDA